MPGVLSHLIAAVVSLFVVHFIHFRWEFSLSIFVGSFVPDVMRHGLTAIKQGTIAIFNLEKDGYYHVLSELTGSYATWVTVGIFILGLTVLLYHFHYIQKKKVKDYNELYLFLLIGIAIHLIMDVFLPGIDPWI